jgi:hypothetical protein
VLVKITLDKEAMLASEDCWLVDGNRVSGWQTGRGVVFVKAENGHAWCEFHGDGDQIWPGGYISNPGLGMEPTGANVFYTPYIDAMLSDPTLTYGAVNFQAVHAKLPQAVTIHRTFGRFLNSQRCAWARFEGGVQSVTIRGAIDPRPLNAWIATNGHVEVHW